MASCGQQAPLLLVPSNMALCSRSLNSMVPFARRRGTSSHRFSNNKLVSTTRPMATSTPDTPQTGLTTSVENKEAPALRTQQPPISLIVDHWDPFSFSTRSLKQMMERVFSEAPTNTTMSLLVEPCYMRVPWDAVEDDECYKMRIDLPGFNKEEVKVQVEEGILIVNAEHKEEENQQQQEKEWWSTRRRTHGKYRTRIALPQSVEAAKVTAKLSNGVLEVWIPKIKKEKQVLDVKLE